MAGEIRVCSISKLAAKEKIVTEDLIHCKTMFSSVKILDYQSKNTLWDSAVVLTRAEDRKRNDKANKSGNSSRAVLTNQISFPSEAKVPTDDFLRSPPPRSIGRL